MQQLKIERNEDGTYTVTIDGEKHECQNTAELHKLLQSKGI